MGQPSSGVLGWVRQQGEIQGLDYVDFNYPQHFQGPLSDQEKEQIRETLAQSGLECGAVCLRYPRRMQLGAFTNPDSALREAAIQLTKEACEWSLALGSDEVVVWSAFDGYVPPSIFNPIRFYFNPHLHSLYIPSTPSLPGTITAFK